MDWKNIALQPDQTLREALRVIDEGGVQGALVVDNVDHLKGIVTDGDIRRGILRGIELDTPVSGVMNTDPVTARPADDPKRIIQVMKQRRIHQLPVVDDEGKVTDLKVLAELLQPQRRTNPVMIMAGGLGTRLRPLTNDCPKPLLEVGGQPILETILDGFLSYGFCRFRFFVNYKAEMIEDYFGDGSDWGAEITYVHEEKRLGTAGPLSLIEERPEEPFFVMNGDLLTTLNMGHVLDYHQQQNATATMCVRDYEVQVPYGVIETEDQRMIGLEEKPVHRHFVNAGVYVLAPETLNHIPDNEFFDMPDLFESVIDAGQKSVVFPIREYWQDVGQKEDFNRAQGEYDEVFAG